MIGHTDGTRGAQGERLEFIPLLVLNSYHQKLSLVECAPLSLSLYKSIDNS